MQITLTDILLGIIAVEGAYLAWRFRGLGAKFKPQAPPIWRAPQGGKLIFPLPVSSECTSITEVLDYIACGINTLLMADDQRYFPPKSDIQVSKSYEGASIAEPRKESDY